MTKREVIIKTLLDNYKDGSINFEEAIDEIDNLDAARNFRIDDFRNGAMVGVIVVAVVDYIIKLF